ncbi:SAM-dependent methyltransferase [bacterium]|nr:MAG: SAM-dependent methyltransferase [bacterium]
MILPLDTIKNDLRCPKTGQALDFGIESAQTIDKIFSYRYIDGKPVLIDFETFVMNIEDFFSSMGNSIVARSDNVGPIGKRLRDVISPVHPTSKKNLAAVQRLLNDKRRSRLLVVGGGEIGGGAEPLYADDNIELLSFDIYNSPNVQFIADAHKIPLASHSVDCVVIQYVLEHVLDPQQVVGEIHRVLKDNAIVYAETPFLEQVHEGPLDFTRFTESGHRYLFKQFELIDSGVIAGAGTHLAWSIEHFARALFRSWGIGKVFKLLFSWLQYFDRIIPESYNIDAADSVYFMGRKTKVVISPNQIIPYYQGRNRKRSNLKK